MFLFLGAVLAGCGGGRVAATPGPSITADAPAGGDSLAGAGSPSGGLELAPFVRPPEPSLRAADLISGHRVQVFTSGRLAEAETVRDRIREAGLPVYVEYRAPLYRVRVGDCTDLAEAVALRERAIAMGYDRAVVVPTLIRSAGRPAAPVSQR